MLFPHQRFRAFSFGDFLKANVLFDGVGADQRAHEHVVLPISDLYPFGRSIKMVEELIANRFVQKNAARSRTTLAGSQKGSDQGLVNRFFQVRILPNDSGVLATHFQR